ncbi:MAG: hypothetical protein JWQ90_5094 [Hydrocarboniphaga sp.]|uniref:hypothetical protein n=1 Tax=Hydrocarboniphaga sp. TaxID=2033016 RepID=UPI00262BD007|nr:hypothetical protein [Hydrocarboniphaga sp.]MDB5972644.1 hypothetical protein [Hydrocarboniphaga sp.]
MKPNTPIRGISLLLIAAALALVPALGSARDRDDNPPGPAGGPGTNWENPPGEKGGPGASPDRPIVISNQTYQFRAVGGGYYYHPDYGYYNDKHGYWNQGRKCWSDNDNNPPGRAGGPGTNWENPPGRKGGPGTSPDRYHSCK